MRKVYNNIIPFSGYKAMAIYPFIFIRNEHKEHITEETINHELIHFEQQKELAIIPFFVIYIIEWILKLFTYGNKSYNNISFERESKLYMGDLKYIEKRKRYSFFKYMLYKTKKQKKTHLKK